jgi:hypothetical protein
MVLINCTEHCVVKHKTTRIYNHKGHHRFDGALRAIVCMFFNFYFLAAASRSFMRLYHASRSFTRLYPRADK